MLTERRGHHATCGPRPQDANHPPLTDQQIDYLIAEGRRATTASRGVRAFLTTANESECHFKEMRSANAHRNPHQPPPPPPPTALLGHNQHPYQPLAVSQLPRRPPSMLLRPLPLLPTAAQSTTTLAPLLPPPPPPSMPLQQLHAPPAPQLSPEPASDHTAPATPVATTPLSPKTSTTVCSSNTGGFAPTITPQARRRHNTKNGGPPNVARSLADFEHGDGTDGTYELSDKQLQVLTALRTNVSLYLIQELGSNSTLATIMLALFKQRGIDGYASPAPRNDTAAGLAFLWRTDVWTLAANPIVDWEGRIATIKLLNAVDSQTYVFTNTYLYQSGKDATSKRNLGNALLNQARGRYARRHLLLDGRPQRTASQPPAQRLDRPKHANLRGATRRGPAATPQHVRAHLLLLGGN
jgi:hypothetical protein